MNIAIVNGPNLNLLGLREPDIYGTETLEQVNAWIVAEAALKNGAIRFYQSNHEGGIIDYIHGQIGQVDGMVINPGAYTHTSYAIRDAIAAVDYRVMEVHLSDIGRRESFRQLSVLTDVCVGQIVGHGKRGYVEAIELLIAPSRS